MNISAISLSLTRPGGGVSAPLTPEQLVAALFANGEQGAWYDPSDLTTLFQAYTGGAVTEVEQPVGIMLDKRKALALEAALNVDFTSGWSGVAGGTVTDSNTFTCTSVGGITKSMLTIGKAYKLTVSYVKTGLSTQFTINNHSGSTTNTIYTATAASGSATITFYATNASLYFRCDTADTIDVTWSIQAIEGNHAYQTTSSARPHLRSRYNLLTYSEQFDNGAWSKAQILAFGSGSIANATTAPDGTTTADSICATSGTTTKEIFQQIISSSVSGAAYTMSIYAKKNTHGIIQLWFATGSFGTNAYANFDVENGVLGTVGASATASIQSVGNGWYRCALTATATSSTTYWHDLNLVGSTTALRSATFAAVGTEAVYLWGAQMVLGTAPLSYQRIAAAPTLSQPPTYATTSTMGGEVFRPYLWFDGSDDILQTASINFSAGDAMTLCTGVRKIHNANFNILTELSTSATDNAGSFAVFAPLSAGQNTVSYRAGGTTRVTISGTANNLVQYVVTAQNDISDDSMSLRVNGVSAATSTSDQGTGNFGTYALYVGSRAGEGRFSGEMYGMVIRGAATSDTDRGNVESYMATKTGVTL